VASFTASPKSGASPLNVQFTDASTGTPTAWSWHFGDGTMSSVKDPEHTYSEAGTYQVTMTATSDAGWSATDPQTTSQTITVSSPTPNAPTDVIATAGNESATVTWTAPTNDGGSPITGYTVTSSPDSITATGTSSPITVTGLTNGTAYTFTVVATNALGDAAPSSPTNSLTPAAPTNGSGGGGTGGGGTGGGGGGGGGSTGEPVSVGGTVSSDPAGTTPTATNPVVVNVTSPIAGTVSIVKSTSSTTVTGYRTLGINAQISAPAATASQPLKLTFEVYVGNLPAGSYPTDVTVFRDGAAIGPCAGADGVASPDPCVADSSVSNGVETFTVLTSHASSWDLQAAIVGRLAGADRYATAVAVSQASFPSGGAGAVKNRWATRAAVAYRSAPARAVA
jgi:PKD repeat protein